MNYDMEVVFKGTYVEARSAGDKSYESAVTLWTEITRVCGENNCYKILGIGESITPMPTMAVMNHEKLFKDFAITRKYKIAWVELNAKAGDSVQFLETVLFNRGMLNGRLFVEVDQARRWLLET